MRAAVCMAMSSLFVLPSDGSFAGSEIQSGLRDQEETRPPLFESVTTLELTVSAPLSTILRDRNQRSEEHPGTVSYEGADGETVTVPVDLKTRGNSRLQHAICEFPPLRFDFPKKRVAGTVFEGQDKLRLVSHCQENSDYEQFLLKEYLVYRTYSSLTELSYRVRLANITYIDTDNGGETITRYGFFVEPEDAMAARNGWEIISIPRIHPDAFDPASLSLMELFQYMVGNVDWDSFLAEPGDEECCHNTQPIGLSRGPAFSVPYDFDVTGMVDPRYANRLIRETLQRFDLRNVRERLYRGRCRSEEYLDGSIQTMIGARDSIYEMYRSQDGLDLETLEEALEYLDDFFEIVTDPGRVRRHLTRNCRQI